MLSVGEFLVGGFDVGGYFRAVCVCVCARACVCVCLCVRARCVFVCVNRLQELDLISGFGGSLDSLAHYLIGIIIIPGSLAPPISTAS